MSRASENKCDEPAVSACTRAKSIAVVKGRTTIVIIHVIIRPNERLSWIRTGRMCAATCFAGRRSLVACLIENDNSEKNYSHGRNSVRVNLSPFVRRGMRPNYSSPCIVLLNSPAVCRCG